MKWALEDLIRHALAALLPAGLEQLDSHPGDFRGMTVVHPETRDHQVIALQFIAPFRVLQADFTDLALFIRRIERLVTFPQCFRPGGLKCRLDTCKFATPADLLGEFPIFRLLQGESENGKSRF